MFEGCEGFTVRLRRVQLSLVGGLLSTTQTKRRDWPSGTERDEPFSRAVGAGERDRRQSDRAIKRKRKTEKETSGRNRHTDIG